MSKNINENGEFIFRFALNENQFSKVLPENIENVNIYEELMVIYLKELLKFVVLLDGDKNELDPKYIKFNYSKEIKKIFK